MDAYFNNAVGSDFYACGFQIKKGKRTGEF
jgi:hypothetical protein